METIVIQAATIDEVKLIIEFVKKNKLNSRTLTEDDKEDIVLGRLMEETDYKDVIDTETFLKKLRN